MAEMQEMRGMEFRYRGVDCYVVHCDPEMGITTHRIDTDKPICCLNKRELVRHIKTFTELSNKEINDIYTTTFNGMIEDIKGGKLRLWGWDPEGVVKIEVDDLKTYKWRGNPSTCAYK